MNGSLVIPHSTLLGINCFQIKTSYVVPGETMIHLVNQFSPELTVEFIEDLQCLDPHIEIDTAQRLLYYLLVAYINEPSYAFAQSFVFDAIYFKRLRFSPTRVSDMQDAITMLRTRLAPDLSHLHLVPPILEYEQLYRTQKVRGLVEILRAEESAQLTFSFKSDLIKNTRVYPYDTNFKGMGEMVFFRPCPVRPRHGFVNSQCLRQASDSRGIVAKARCLDPHSEFLIMPYANGKYSALFTPDMVSFGLGMSACTSGGSNTVALPVPTTQYFTGDTLKNADVTYPYIETVEHDKHLNIVQLRDGPAISGRNHYIPQEVTVKNIFEINPETDLLQFEFDMKCADPATTVVYAPDIPITSHYGAHAVANGIAFITKWNMIHGDKLSPNIDLNSAPNYNDYHKLRMEIMVTMERDIGRTYNIPLPHSPKFQKVCASIAASSIVTGHGAPIWDPTTDSVRRLLAGGLVSFIALYAAALYGELRHYGKYAKGKKPYTKCKLSESNERSSVYYSALNTPAEKLIQQLSTIEYDFMYKGWNGSYGGRNWASATHSLHVLYADLKHFCVFPSRETWMQVVTQWHTCINEQHNGGAILTKYVSSDFFELAAGNIVGGMLNRDVIRYLLINSLMPELKIHV